MDFLQKNAYKVEEIRAQREKELEKRRRFIEVVTTRKPGTGPLLRRVTPEGVRPPVYEPGIEWPRPLSIFPSGVHKPPTLVATSAGVPFLRFGGRQSRFLERVLRQKTNWRMEKIRILLDTQDEGMEWARDEDQWEELMGLLFVKENPDAVRELGQEDQMPDEPSYASSLHGICAVLIDEIQAETEDQVARAKALWKMVLMEREQALKEAKERLEREGKGEEEPQIKSWRRPVWEKKTPKWMREKGFDKKNARKATLEKRKEDVSKAMEKFWWFKKPSEAGAVDADSKNTASQLPAVAGDPAKTKQGEASVGKRAIENNEHSLNDTTITEAGPRKRGTNQAVEKPNEGETTEQPGQKKS